MSNNSMLPDEVKSLIHFDTLLEQGMEAIEQYSGQVWTDKGEQDPGVTLLQDLSYGVSDLAYRHTLPLVDLLTPADTSSGDGIFPASFGPHRVLTCGPVTVDDYRRALLDLHSPEGETPVGFYFRNVQLTPESEAEQYQYWYDPDKWEFTFARPASMAEPTQLTLKGNYHLYVELARGADQAKAQTALDDFLKVNRNLCEAVRETTWVEPLPLELLSTLELEDDCTDYNRVLAELYRLSDSYLNPMAVRVAASELSEQGVGNEVIYQGPQLQHGWITRLPAARDYSQPLEVDLSPLVNIWLSIDGVKSVTDLGGNKLGNWHVSVDPNKYLQLWGSDPVASLERDKNIVYLYKKGQRCLGDRAGIEKYITAAPLISEKDVVMPYGRNRKPAEFHSLSKRLPPCYGLQQPSPEDTQKQLHQFLLPFEQALANGCQQLALLPDLLAFDRSQSTPVWGIQWPFAAESLSDKVHQAYKPQLLLMLKDHRQKDNKELATIDYLLGYFGSQRAPRTLSRPFSDFLKVQRGYLRQHADLGYQRSNIQVQEVSALQKRIAARIGVGSELFDQKPALDKLPFYLVEHRALLPVMPDGNYNAEQTPLDCSVSKEWVILYVPDEPVNSLFHCGLLIDLVIKNDGGSGGDYIINNVMVKSIAREDDCSYLNFLVQDNEQLLRDLDRLSGAMAAGTLRWKNSNTWLQDMWYPLHYDADTKLLNEGEKRIVATQDAPYPVMLQQDDQIAIRRQNSPKPPLLESDDNATVYAQVVSRDWINGSFVIKAKDGSTLPEKGDNHRWYIDNQDKTISDRFSFMVSLVFPRSLLAGLTDASTTEAWIKQCILDEIPCHISALVHWLDDSAFAQFGVAYQGWQNNGSPLGDRSYQLLKQLTLGRTPSVLDGLGHMRIATAAQQQAATVPGWNPDYISENELFYVPKN
ncbi:hypothetical protein C1Y35_31995 [Pseudomonas sp. GW456-L14]|uniref:hypothetical protein n=1 Tax=unclassified Pseudomonas TaxID=196821 RepID=UPI000C882B9D|nr:MULTISPECIES: hypothetical protein [unclassified Pseudomonas]PMY29146.1 hypothetical protein C1Y35_31995 [Pseudomonas sp. GW456-L14]PMY46903.1 hypothetical protein C1Y34_31870 [Pseudomonas sp. GW456-L12]